MRRIAAILFVLATTAGALVASGATGGSQAPRYWVQFDNGFGLVEGADVKIAGTPAGSITDLELDRETYHALAEIEITSEGFGDLRRDAFCEIRPQSLLGEYFIDCQAGDSEERLPEGGRLPVEQTGSTVPVDLIQNIMRRPWRERWSLFLGELGAAVAARGEDLNEVIRRANPALREVNRVLADLAAERRTIAQLADDAEQIVTALADNRRDVGRFVVEAGEMQETVTRELPALRAQLQRLPTFLRELRPSMVRLDEAASNQAPALRALAANSQRLEGFLERLTTFSEVSRPAMRTLASAARTGRPALEAASPRIEELTEFARPVPELTGNAAIILEHLHDRRFAVEKDPRTPGGEGYTGLEAFLAYIFRQTQAVNLFDANSYLLKVSPFVDNLCAQYTNAEQARDPSRARCISWLGPSRPGIDGPVQEERSTRSRSRSGEGDGRGERRAKRRGRGGDRREAGEDGRGGAGGGEQGDGDAPARPRPPVEVPDLGELLDSLPAPARPPGDDRVPKPLLDFLLGP
jgi:ABC-type transporter Mla subunit MlaD